MRIRKSGGLVWVLPALLMTTTLALGAGCRDAPKAATPPPQPVQVTAVVERDVPIYGEWIGTTVGYVTAQIRPKVNGYLTSQDYQEGTLVKANDVLFHIDPRQYQNALDSAAGKLGQAESQKKQAVAQLAENAAQADQAKANVIQVESDLARAMAIQKKTELEVMRYTPLTARGSLSQQELDNATQNNLANIASVEGERANLLKARANVERAQAAVDKARADVSAAEAAIVSAQASLAEAKLNLAWTKVTSLIDGIAGIKKADVGDLVGPASILTTVATINPIYVQLNLSEQQYLRWREAQPGTPKRGRSDFELILADGGRYPHPGTAEILGLAVDATTGTIPVRATFPNPGNILRPGQYAKVRVPIVVQKNALLVPARAVRDLQGLYQVGVVAPDDTASIRTVQVGDRVGTSWVITKGLKPGERIIVEGLEKVRSGEKVNPIVAKAEPEEGAAGSAAPPPPAPSKPAAPPKPATK
jgi:membrane fusion protein (multidrug efflux system)